VILDALIVGGGPAGGTAAVLLARKGLRVMVADKASFPRRKVCGEYISATTWPILEELGVAAGLAARAGPPVERVGLFARDVSIDAPMPKCKWGQARLPDRHGEALSRGTFGRATVPDPVYICGRAVGREILDATLLERAAREGAQVLQHAAVEALHRDGGIFIAKVGDWTVRARRVVMACGSWERGPFTPRLAPRASDLLGFKARFSRARLPSGLMPLVLFPGGYGGLVHTDAGEVSFSCCIRRDALGRARGSYPGGAGAAVLAHAMKHSRALREALGEARVEGAWLSAGPIRPGIRHLIDQGMERVGNAAGEAHPLVAEGISMAIQSSWLLARHWDDPRSYARAWRETFAARIRASSLFMTLTVPALPSRASIAVMKRSPAVLTWGARWSGKARMPQAHAA
jgi:flavin-dependent dehydrogenase